MMKGLARLTSLVVVWGSVQGLHGQAPTAPDPLLDLYLSQEYSVTIDGMSVEGRAGRFFISGSMINEMQPEHA